MAVEADVCDAEAVNVMIAAVVGQWGAIHILINNAGINIRKRRASSYCRSPTAHR